MPDDSAHQARADDFGPILRGGDRPRRSRRAVTFLAAFLGAVMLFSTGLAATLVLLGGGVDRIEVAGLNGTSDTLQGADEAAALEEVSGVTNVLVVGSDSREGLTEEQLLAIGTQDDGGPKLTDTIILLQLNAEDDRAQVLSFPRDLLVTHCDGSQGRINAAYRHGEDLEYSTGPDCLVQTVTRLTGIGIDHYVELDFEGFIRAVDAVGGVTFHVDEPLVDRHAGLNVEPGCVTFDGAKALGFVRARHLDSDFGRIARQQRFLRELLAEATSVETLANPGKVMGLARAVSTSLTTDDRLSTLQMAQLAYTFRELTNDGLETYTVPGYDADWNGAQVLMLDKEEAATLFAQFRQSSGPSFVAGATPPPGGAAQAPAGDAAPGEPADDAQDATTDPGSPAGEDSTAGPEPAADPTPQQSFAASTVSDVNC